MSRRPNQEWDEEQWLNTVHECSSSGWTRATIRYGFRISPRHGPELGAQAAARLSRAIEAGVVAGKKSCEPIAHRFIKQRGA